MDKKKNKKKLYSRKRLPKELLFIPSSDKNFVEKWTEHRDPLNFPKSFRMVLLGKPGVGKTCMIKNIILRVQESKKPFERVIVMHQDKYAREYDDVDGEVIIELPNNDYWMGYDDEEEPEEDPNRPPTLLILDDICFKDLPKEQTMKLDRLCGFISTHCNVSLAVINQDCFAVNPIIRKCANIWCVWRPTDTDQLNTIARRVGFKPNDFKYLFDNMATKESDSIMVDMSPGSPYPLRLNGFKMIKRTE